MAEPSLRPKLWPLALLLLGSTSGAILFGLVHQNGSSTTTTVVMIGGLLLSAVAVAVVAAAAMALVTWITVMVLLSLIGRTRRRLVAEGKKISKEIMVGFVVKVLLKEGNVMGAISAAVLGYLAFAWGPLLFFPTPNYFG
ncbi:uncharacterized protein LOC120088986 [Benincasa hispida]|uniref:uncharacterized protein LOC120088986 n=1 Tax=Benincasa hispida TaxID=102211 RepID=UPI001901EBC3|nr:uncharacterized protein LOC120088986 [Benincasa hispida]